METEYIASLEHVNGFNYVQLGSHDRLRKARLAVKQALATRNSYEWGWHIHKYVDGRLINSRSSVAGFENLEN